MKYVVSFFLGAAVGAVAALLYAPSSGEELRHRIRAEAEDDLGRLQSEFNTSVADLQKRIDNLTGEVQNYLEQARAKMAQQSQDQ